jgi:hypothetical protein
LIDNVIPIHRSLLYSPDDVMMNGFDVSNWNYNDNSDLSLFIIADDSIDLIKDYNDIMTDRLRHQLLEASPHARI